MQYPSGPRYLLLLILLTLCSVASALNKDLAVAAVEAGSKDEVARLLQSEPLEQLFRVREAGQGLLHIALRRDDDAWALFLEAGWPVSKEKGWSPTHEAALAGNSEALAAMLRAGAKVNLREPTNGGTPLHVAAFNGHLAAVKVLVGAGAKVNARDNDGWTALSQAKDQGFPQIMEWLKKNGATR